MDVSQPAGASPRRRIPVILDMDPGVDDALAILLAMRSPELDVKAITTCSGNTSARRGALNALKTLQAAGADMPPVAAGATRPLRRSPWLRGGVHGADGLGDVIGRYPHPDGSRIHPADAPSLIVETARQYPDARLGPAGDEPLAIIATGPLTNIALAIAVDPEAMRRISRIVWMGGAYGAPGNVTPAAEFNAFYDPEAAQEVFRFDIPVTAVGLDVTQHCLLARAQINALVESTRSQRLRFAWEITQRYTDFYRENDGCDACCLHDPLAVGLAIWPELVQAVETRAVEVVADAGAALGMTMVDRRRRNPWENLRVRAALDRMSAEDAAVLRDADILAHQPTSTIVYQVDSTAFVRRFLERIT